MEPTGQTPAPVVTQQAAPMQNQGGGSNSTNHLITMFMNGLFLGVGFYVAIYVGSKVGKKTISTGDIKSDMSGANGYQTMMYANRQLPQNPNMNPYMNRQQMMHQNHYGNQGGGYRQFDGQVQKPFNMDMWLKGDPNLNIKADQVDLSKVKD